ncbi:MAG: zf-HC2 domain-containing protein [Candidatus Marinimicrobia bacterium]|nr:zf-HC2 domain-containing protein [Candidatus Neomarinimicrobiota bacterium]
MNCYEVRDIISSYIENELSIQSINQFDEHVNNCKNCDGTYLGVLSLITTLRSSPRITVSNRFNSKLQERINNVSIKTINPISHLFRDKLVFGFEPKYAFVSIIAVVAIIFLMVGLLPTNENPSLETSIPTEITPVFTGSSSPNDNPGMYNPDVNLVSETDGDSVKTTENKKGTVSDFEGRIKLVKDRR